MAEDEKTKIIEVTSDENKSPEELEAEIAHAATTLGGEKKSKDKSTLSTTKSSSSKKKKSAKPSTKKIEKPAIKVSQRKAVIMADPTEDEEAPAKSDETEEHIIKVRRTQKKVIEPVAQPKPSNDIADSKEDEEEPLPTPKPDTESDSDETIIEVKKKIVPPPPATSTEPAEPKQATIEESAPKQEEKKIQQAPSDPPAAEEASDKLSELSSELAENATDKELKNSDQAQQAKVYDTQKYHLPIKPNRHSRNSSMPLWLQIIILLISLAGAGYYAYTTNLLEQITDLL